MTSSTSSARSAMTLFRERHGTMRGLPVFDAEGGASGVSDEAAALLREVMALKASNRAAAERLAQFAAAGVTPERVAELEAAATASAARQAQAKEDAALAAGDWETVRASLAATHKAEKAELDARLAKARKDTEDQTALITDLTIGAAFSGSKFLTEETIFTSSKARKVYGDHFDFEDNQVIAYDAPRGAENREPLVDGAGQPLPFDAAMRHLIEADPDRDTIKRSARLAGGKGAKAAAPAHVGSGIDRIAAGLRERQGNTEDAPGASLNHRDTNKPQPVTTAARRDVGPSRIADALKAGSLPGSSRGGPIRTSP